MTSRLTSLSSDKESFDSAKGVYQEALNKSGYHYNLSFTPSQEPRSQNSRPRNILWFNPPYSKSAATNVGKCFLSLINKHFPKSNPLHKIFNCNTLKLSYSCMGNIITKLNSTNRRAPIMKRKTVIAGNPTRALWMETATWKMSSTRLKSPLTPRRKPTSDFVTLLLN